jgi:hypothetical protein
MRHLLYFAFSLVLLLILLYCRGSSTPGTSHPRTDDFATGQEVFSNNYASCHSLEEDGIGSRLGGITKIMSVPALMNFIRNPARTIADGDLRAMILYNKYNHFDSLSILA